jgi:hypothetical protein
MKASQPAPKDLKQTGVALWRKITREFGFNSVELELLHRLCVTIDEIAAMRADLSEMGMVVAGSERQPRANPLIDKLVAHRKLADQLSTALALPIEGEAAGQRRSVKSKMAADARWRQARSRGRLNVVGQWQKDGA